MQYLSPVGLFQKGTERPHDGKQDELLEVVARNLLVIVTLGDQTLEQVNRLTDVVTLQNLQAETQITTLHEIIGIGMLFSV